MQSQGLSAPRRNTAQLKRAKSQARAMNEKTFTFYLFDLFRTFMPLLKLFAVRIIWNCLLLTHKYLINETCLRKIPAESYKTHMIYQDNILIDPNKLLTFRSLYVTSIVAQRFFFYWPLLIWFAFYCWKLFREQKSNKLPSYCLLSSETGVDCMPRRNSLRKSFDNEFEISSTLIKILSRFPIAGITREVTTIVAQHLKWPAAGSSAIVSAQHRPTRVSKRLYVVIIFSSTL